FEVFAIVAPRLPIYPSCRIFPQALIRLLQQRHLDVTQQVGEPLLLLLSGSLSDPLQHCSYGFPVLCPAVRRWADFLFAALRPSIDSPGVTRDFVDFFGTMSASDFPEAFGFGAPCPYGLRLVAFPRLRVVHHRRREVHKTGCSWQPEPRYRLDLGDHSGCHTAVAAAKRHYPTADGCGHCSAPCHT